MTPNNLKELIDSGYETPDRMEPLNPLETYAIADCPIREDALNLVGSGREPCAYCQHQYGGKRLETIPVKLLSDFKD